MVVEVRRKIDLQRNLLGIFCDMKNVTPYKIRLAILQIRKVYKLVFEDEICS